MGTNGYELPELLPQPKHIRKLDGFTELSADVRLVTTNVYPLQRKAVRSILSSAGVRVVANKKKFVVDARVEPAENFNLQQVPPEVQKDYYELTVKGSEVFIRAPHQDGTVWASQTLATLFTLFLQGRPLPNLCIQDWPAVPVRGVFMESNPARERMNQPDWCQVIDSLSALKYNLLCLEIYGTDSGNRFQGLRYPQESLCCSIPTQDALKTTSHLDWYSPAKGRWVHEDYLPFLREKEDALAELLAYGAEKGIAIVPVFSSLGANTFLPRCISEISAKDASGKATGAGYCTSSEKTRSFLAKFYGSFLERYYPAGVEYFHLRMDESGPEYPSPAAPTKAVPSACKCKMCAKKRPEALFQDYLLWLTEFLVSKGVRKVVLWGSSAVANRLTSDASFAKKLASAGLQGRLALHWRSELNTGKPDPALKSAAKVKGFEAWYGSRNSLAPWLNYENRIPSAEGVLCQAESGKANGVVSFCNFDLAVFSHEALMGLGTWEGGERQGAQTRLARWATALFGERSKMFLQTVQTLQKASVSPLIEPCLFHLQSPVSAGKGMDSYPANALAALEKNRKAADGLREVAQWAGKAKEGFTSLLAEPEQAALGSAILRSLQADAIRLQALAEAFGFLLALRQELAPGMVLKRMSTSAMKVREDFQARLAQIEVLKPSWLAPVVLHPLSRLYAFLGQLVNDLKEHAARKQASQIRWCGVPATGE
ncbi:MAG: hypothetical protein IJJ33_20105 [Victivallales bacterium]|nr:hypothetical protein [Victivallales bacterium]